jgi:NodT family efflux transporter outer membrane factor (OMF) lipoprotein
VRLRVGASALLALASACAPPATPPPVVAVTPNAAWRTASGPVAPLADGWWRAFGDPVLDGLVDRALGANPDLAIAAARVREARAQERLARAQLVPTLDAGVSGAEARTLSPFGAPSEGASAQPVFQAAYEVDLFGRIADQTRAARLSVQASEDARAAARLSIAAAVTTGYLTLRGLDARLAITRSAAADRAEALRIARNRSEAGYTSQLELRQAEAEYRSATQLVPQLELAVSRQENALAVLLGETPRALPRGLALSALATPSQPAVLPSELLRRRPDVAQAERTLAASDATLSAARKQFLPQLRLSASAGAVVASALSAPVTVWSLGGSVLAPLFEGGRLRAGVEGAAARRDQAAFAYQRTVLTAFRETEDALAAVARLSQQLAETQAQRNALAEALRHARNRYEAGYTSYLEQLDAQRSLFAADTALVQQRTDLLNAYVALDQAAGGGWTELPR